MKMGLFHEDSKEPVYRRYFYPSKGWCEYGIDFFFQMLKKYLSTRRNFSIFTVTKSYLRESTLLEERAGFWRWFFLFSPSLVGLDRTSTLFFLIANGSNKNNPEAAVGCPAVGSFSSLSSLYHRIPWAPPAQPPKDMGWDWMDTSYFCPEGSPPPTTRRLTMKHKI